METCITMWTWQLLHFAVHGDWHNIITANTEELATSRDWHSVVQQRPTHLVIGRAWRNAVVVKCYIAHCI